ncbi:MAG: molecular chaperone DnaJ [Clostridiales bacterium]|nr:molecular chaperone DnaJ [Clostridiales bacterium]
MAQNYYEILGVSKTASQDEIKSAYRKLARQYHPDLHPGDKACEEKFKQINEANETLSDPQKRSQYDYTLDHPNAGGFGGFGGGFSGGGFDFGDIFGDIFSQFTGGGRSSRPQAQKGEDITIELSISFMDAIKGCTRSVSYTRNETCSSCKGTRAKNGTEFTKCEKCNGTGQIRYVSQSSIFQTVNVRPCSDCHGTGKKIKEPCPDCKGKGYVKKKTELQIEIPAGVDNGNILKKRGLGEASVNGGPAGDLNIIISVLPHKIFKRKGADLYVELPISYKTAVFGGKVQVPGVDDTFTYTVPEGTQSGKMFCVRSKGVKSRMGSGDLYLTVVVEVPKALTKEQKKQLEALDESIDNDKQYVKIKAYQDNVNSLYGVDPYK